MIRTLGAAKADANARLRPSLYIVKGRGELVMNAAERGDVADSDAKILR